MELKGRFPFRIGTTSFVLHADMETNVEYLARKVDDIELLVFESDDMAELPRAETLRLLGQKAADHGLSYTVHLPLDIWLGDAEGAERERSVKKCVRTIDRMGSLDPFAYILHCNRVPMGGGRIDGGAFWKSSLSASLDGILAAGVAPRLVCVETLDYSFAMIEDLVLDRGMSVCIDIGHLLLNSLSVADHLRWHLPHCRVIHLHGVANGKDHHGIDAVESSLLSGLFSLLQSDRDRERVVTLEVFDEADFNKSLSVVEEYVQ
jgi:sugar phosphate isomerase/epimerase